MKYISNKKYISILIPVYKNHKFAIEAIDSAYKYLRFVDGIVVIDDCPEFSLLANESACFKRWPEIVYKVNSSNLGRVKNYSRLVEECSSEYFLMLDGDDLLDEFIDFNYLNSLLAKFKGISMLAGRCQEFSENGAIRITGPRMTGLKEGLQYFLDWVGSKNMLPHNSCIMNTGLVRSIGSYSSDCINSDIVLVRNLMLKGKILGVKNIIGRWRYHGKNTSNISDMVVLARNIDSILIPYENLWLSKAKDSERILWVISSITNFIVSCGHQIISSNGNRENFKEFNRNLFGYHEKYTPIIKIGFFIGFLKLYTLRLIVSIFGLKLFSKIMSKRGNYLYNSTP